MGFDLSSLLLLVQKGGAILAPFFAVMWWLERSERLNDRRADATRNDKRDNALAEMKVTLATLTRILHPHGGQS